jgi:hypothetical protein
LFQVAQREFPIAEPEINKGQVEWGHVSSQCVALQFSELRLRADAIAGSAVSVAEPRSDKRRLLHRLCLDQFGNCITGLPGFDVDPPIGPRREKERRVEFGAALRKIFHVLKPAFPDGRQDSVQPNLCRQRVEFRRATAFGDRLRCAQLQGQSERELIVGERVVRLERECLAELGFQAFPIAFVEKLEDRERCFALESLSGWTGWNDMARSSV